MIITFCNLIISFLRSQLMLIGNEPRLALEDLKEVMAEEPESIPGYCIKVNLHFLTGTFYLLFSRQNVCL